MSFLFGGPEKVISVTAPVVGKHWVDPPHITGPTLSHAGDDNIQKIVTLPRVDIPKPPVKPPVENPSSTQGDDGFFTGVREGYQFAWQHPIDYGTDLFKSIFGSAEDAKEYQRRLSEYRDTSIFGFKNGIGGSIASNPVVLKGVESAAASGVQSLTGIGDLGSTIVADIGLVAAIALGLIIIIKI